MTWDCIVVGAGSAGCALAYELVRAGKKVLVIEAGGSDRSPYIWIPAAVWKTPERFEWGYRAQPDLSRKGVVDPWHRGKVLGGTSSINGMIYVRGAAADFDRWGQLCGGKGGWSARDVMPIFRELEQSDQRSPLRGRSGPLHVRTVRRPHPLTDGFVESAFAAGHPFNPDYNGATQEGAGYLQFTQRRGLRWSAADAFLRPLVARTNLKLLLNATVERVEISNGRAVGVSFRHRGALHREAARDIVLSAGVINSPKLLMLSGIGDPVELRRHKIDVVLDLPAVGRHLREHPVAELSYRTRIPSYNLTEGLLQKIAIAAKYMRFREGPIAAAYEATAFLKTHPSASMQDIQVFFAPIGWGVVDGALQLARHPALKICIVRSHSVSSGRVRLSSPDPETPPLIECPLLENEADIDTLARGIQTIRTIMGTQPIADLVEAETTPGQRVEGLRDLHEHLRDHLALACHPIGTCRMGISADTVVDPELRVHGLENLWVADASIMPDHISANINAPCMMIGAKLGKQLIGRG